MTPLPSDAVTAVTNGFSGVTSLVTTTMLPAILGLVVLGIGIKVAIKFLKKGASSVG